MPRRGYSRGLFAALLLLAVFAVYVTSGVRGVRFGDMWDEGYQRDGVRTALTTLSIWPNGYYYGGLYYAPGYALVAPRFIGKFPAILAEMRDFPSRPFSVKAHPILLATQKAALADLDKSDFPDRTRCVFVAITSLTILWVFLASRSATGSLWAALGAAACVGFSWEYSYHGRWIAVDAMMASFAAPVLVFINLALSTESATRERMLFRLASIAAGLALGCKMPGIFLIVPIVVGLAYSPHVHGMRGWLSRALTATFIMLAVFVATTPGVLFDPLHYADDMFRVANEYNRVANDYTYCEANFLLRLGKIITYCSAVLFSNYLPIALALSAFALLGAFVGVRERQPKVIVALAFLFVYVGFISAQRLLIARNLMSTLPALAMLVAVGLRRAQLLASRFRFGTSVLVAAFAVISVCDARFIWNAAQSVTTSTNHTLLTELRTYLHDSSHQKFYIAPSVESALAADQRVSEAAPNVVSSSWDDAQYVVMYSGKMSKLHANTPKFARYFSSLWANYDYYPSLQDYPSSARHTGDPIIVLSKEHAQAVGIQTPPL